MRCATHIPRASSACDDSIVHNEDRILVHPSKTMPLSPTSARTYRSHSRESIIPLHQHTTTRTYTIDHHHHHHHHQPHAVPATTPQGGGSGGSPAALSVNPSSSPTTIVRLPDSTIRHWAYRVEGALHMVFVYRGNDPQLDARVLRVATAADPPPHPQRTPAAVAAAAPAPAPQDAFRFVQRVFATGHVLAHFVNPGTLVQTDPCFAQDIALAAAPLRPRNRTAARSRVHPQPLLLLQPDCARIFSTKEHGMNHPGRCWATVCVEIKPKAALTSVSRLVPKDICDALDKFSTLTYTIKHYSNAPPEHLDPVPRYSPADLLSGDESRIAGALEVLRRRRAHSLRIFLDGDLILADDLPLSFARYKSLTLGSFKNGRDLIHDMPPTANRGFQGEGTTIGTSGTAADDWMREEAYESALCKDALSAAAYVLSRQPQVMHGIVDMQRRDYVDAIGAEKLWDLLVERLGSEEAAESKVWNAYFAHEALNPEVVVGAEHARELLAYGDSTEAKGSHNNQRMAEAERKLRNLRTEVVARVLADYMVASVVKDCSILVSMSPRPMGYVAAPGTEMLTLPSGEQCLVKVSVVDLEPKPVCKIRAWAARDRERAALRSAVESRGSM